MALDTIYSFLTYPKKARAKILRLRASPSRWTPASFAQCCATDAYALPAARDEVLRQFKPLDLWQPRASLDLQAVDLFPFIANTVEADFKARHLVVVRLVAQFHFQCPFRIQARIATVRCDRIDSEMHPRIAHGLEFS